MGGVKFSINQPDESRGSASRYLVGGINICVGKYCPHPPFGKRRIDEPAMWVGDADSDEVSGLVFLAKITHPDPDLFSYPVAGDCHVQRTGAVEAW